MQRRTYDLALADYPSAIPQWEINEDNDSDPMIPLDQDRVRSDLMFLRERLLDQSSYLTRRGVDVLAALDKLSASMKEKEEILLHDFLLAFQRTLEN